MKKNFNKILACTMSALIMASVSSMPVNTVTAYAPKPSATFIAAESISLNKTELTLGKGESYTLHSTIYPLDVSSKSILWSSSNPKVAYVDTKGKVTAKATGNATITVFTHNGKKSVCYITVKEAPSKITLNSHNIELGAGETYRFYYEIPQNTASFAKRYISSNENIVSFGVNGNITAKKEGSATVTVETFNGKKDTCKVTVKKAPSSVTLSKRSLTLAVGDEYKLNSQISENTASLKKTFSSSDSSIVECDSLGNITAKKAGSAVITVKTFNGKTDICGITVKNAPDKIQIKNTYAELETDDTFRIIYFLPSNTYTNKITYSSSNSDVASVDANGLVTAKNPGSARITVRTANNKTAFVDIKVNEPIQIYEWSSSDDILNSAKVNPVKTNSKLLDDKIDSIFGDILNSRMSNAHKVKACFDYLATNINYAYISYDYSPVYGVNYVSGSDREIVISAYSTLVKKLGNCYDYACTLAAVMQRIGYDAHVVHGLVGMSAGGYGNHYWVDTNINGRHYIFDAQVENNNLGWGGTVNHYFYCLNPNNTSMYIYQETWTTSNFRTY